MTGVDVAMIIGAFLLAIAFTVWLVYSIKRPNKQLESLLAALTPSQISVHEVVAGGATVELRTRAAGSGVYKIWLECKAPSAFGRWTATANVAHSVTTSGATYREAPPEAGATKEPPISFGEDGEGVSATAGTGTRRTGALNIPRGGNVSWLQLMTLPPCQEGAEIFVSVAIGDLTEPAVTFRAFVGVSER